MFELIYLIYTLALAVPLVLYLVLNNINSYWKRKGQPYIPAQPLFGNLTELIFQKASPADLFTKFYNDEKTKEEPFTGIHIFHKPAVLIRDIELVKRVMVKDFNSFSNRHAGADSKTDRLGSDNLFLAKNPMWKTLRNRLVPLFSGAKLRQMFLLMNEIGKEFDAHLSNQKVDVKTQSMRLDIKDWFARFGTDIIATCAYGVKANSIQDPNAPFRVNGRKIFEMSPFRAIEFTSFFLLPEIVQFFGFKFFSPDTSEFLRNSINDVLQQR